jgi:hypothetical protein
MSPVRSVTYVSGRTSAIYLLLKLSKLSHLGLAQVVESNSDASGVVALPYLKIEKL